MIKKTLIPVVFQNARVLAALVHPSHLVCLSSWGFSRLPPTCISKSIGYMAILLALSQPVLGFGQNGHRIVAHIAEQNLNKQTQQVIVQLIDGVPLAKLSTWPDEIRSDDAWKHTSPWHYISVEDDEKVEDAPHPEQGDILAKLDEMEKTLRDKNSTRQEKWQALAFYVHFAADLHQPLHVGRKSDKGGNDVKLSWFGDYVNLHAVWDTNLIENQHMSYTEYANFIDDVEPDQVTKWQSSNHLTWAKESKALRETVYNLPANGKLHYEFAYQNTPILNQRLAQAGFRLASKLNAIFSQSN